MDQSNQISEQNHVQCCLDYCRTAFEVTGQQVVNSYKCRQKQFSSSDMWNILKNRRTFVIEKGL